MNSTLRFWLAWSAGLGLALALMVWALLQWYLSNHSQLVADRLQLLGELRRGAVQEYFATASAELRFWSSSQDMVHAQEELVEIWGSDPRTAARVRQAYVEDNPHPAGFRLNLDDAEDGTEYSEYHALMHARARLFVTKRGYHDFFLISPEGDVLYTVEKEADFATNYARHVLGFIGIHDVDVIAADQMAVNPDAALESAHKAVSELAA